MTTNNLSSHQSNPRSDNWFTPLSILNQLGSFDLDPCTSIYRPWDTALFHYCFENMDGLECSWFGRVWLNPPFSNKDMWLDRMVEHNNGIVLIAARTETKAFFKYVWGKAMAICFIKGRPYFHDIKGNKAKNNCGVPIVLIAYGNDNLIAIKHCSLGYTIIL